MGFFFPLLHINNLFNSQKWLISVFLPGNRHFMLIWFKKQTETFTTLKHSWKLVRVSCFQSQFIMPWVIIWESFCINIILFHVGGTSVVTGDHVHMQKINRVCITLTIKRKNKVWDVFFREPDRFSCFIRHLCYYINTVSIFEKPSLCRNWYIESLIIFRRFLSGEDEKTFFFFSHCVRAKIWFSFFSR